MQLFRSVFVQVFFFSLLARLVLWSQLPIIGHWTAKSILIHFSLGFVFDIALAGWASLAHRSIPKTTVIFIKTFYVMNAIYWILVLQMGSAINHEYLAYLSPKNIGDASGMIFAQFSLHSTWLLLFLSISFLKLPLAPSNRLSRLRSIILFSTLTGITILAFSKINPKRAYRIAQENLLINIYTLAIESPPSLIPPPDESSIDTLRLFLSPLQSTQKFDPRYPLRGITNETVGESHKTSSLPNIIFISMETEGLFPFSPMSPFIREPNAHLDEVRSKTLFFDYAFANSAPTTPSMVQVQCGVVDVANITKTRSRPAFPCLGKILNKIGYQTELVSGITMNLDGNANFLAHSGFQRLHTLLSFADSTLASETHHWPGQTDKKTFQEARDRFLAHKASEKEKPIFMTIMTISGHTSYPIMDASDYANKYDPLLNRYLAAHRYTWREVASFIDSIQSSPIFANTIILGYGDHPPTDMSDHPMIHPAHAAIAYHWVPAFFWTNIPGHPISTRIETTPISQVDIAPTLLHLLDIPNEGRVRFGRVYDFQQKQFTTQAPRLLFGRYTDEHSWIEGSCFFSTQRSFQPSRLSSTGIHADTSCKSQLQSSDVRRAIKTIQALEQNDRI